MKLSTEIIKKFDQDGYVLLKDFFKESSILNSILDEINSIGKILIDDSFEYNQYNKGIITRDKQSLLYDRLHYLPCLSRLSGDQNLIDILYALNFKKPVLMGSCNMRYDIPEDNEHLFDWHQDTLFLLGSLNAVTIWIPFGPVDQHHGTIQVIPGSHKSGLYPFKKISDKPIYENISFLQRDLKLDVSVEDTPETIIANIGDVVIFKQMLLHRSLPNCSLLPRWTAQIRMSDLGCEWFVENKCPTGDRKNIFYHKYPGYNHEMSRV